MLTAESARAERKSVATSLRQRHLVVKISRSPRHMGLETCLLARTRLSRLGRDFDTLRVRAECIVVGRAGRVARPFRG